MVPSVVVKVLIELLVHDWAWWLEAPWLTAHDRA
jgi:hypothetical protein